MYVDVLSIYEVYYKASKPGWQPRYAKIFNFFSVVEFRSPKLERFKKKIRNNRILHFSVQIEDNEIFF